jgi:hypothetical protein
VMDVPDAGQQLQLVAVEVGKDFRTQGREDVSLVDNDDELILLRRKSWRSITEPYNVHRSIWTQVRWCACTTCAGAPCSSATMTWAVAARCQCTPGCLRPSWPTQSTGVVPRRGRCEMLAGWPRIIILVPIEQWIKLDFDTRDNIVDYCLSRYVCRLQDIVVPASQRHRAAPCPWKRMKRKRKANPKMTGNEWVN